jgi:hypothetical protein
MQNTVYDNDYLKEIEKIIYQFIWNGIDRIKGQTLKKSYSSGGLKSPDIFLIDDTCKLKQSLRCSQSNHPIAALQKTNIDFTQLIQELRVIINLS